MNPASLQRTITALTIIPLAIFASFSCSENETTGFLEPAMRPVFSAQEVDFDLLFSLEKKIELEATLTGLIGKTDKIRVNPIDGTIFILDAQYAKMVFAFDSTGAFIRPIGYRGDGPGGAYQPRAFDLDRQSVLIASFSPYKILRFSQQGDFVSSFPLNIPSDSQLLIFPESVVAVDDAVYVQSLTSFHVDQSNGRTGEHAIHPQAVYRFDDAGHFMDSFGEFDAARYRFPLGYKNLFAADKARKRLYLGLPHELTVHEFDADGESLRQWQLHQAGQRYLNRLSQAATKETFRQHQSKLETFIFIEKIGEYLVAMSFAPTLNKFRLTIFEPNASILWIDQYLSRLPKFLDGMAGHFVGSYANGLLFAEERYESEELTGIAMNPNILFLRLNREVLQR